MSIRTDLAVECCEFAVEAAGVAQIEGVTVETSEKNGCTITEVTVRTDAGAKAVGKPLGRYVTLGMAPFSSAATDCEALSEVMAEELRAFLPAEGATLICGLGNDAITPDAIGPKVVEQLFATRHISASLAKEVGLTGLRPVAALAPGVLGQTGMETAEILSAVSHEVSPACVVVVDALAARSLDRLGCTIQLSDTGISPGSGVGGGRSEISEGSLGVPVISIGVPTVVDAATLAHDLMGTEAPPNTPGGGMMVTPKDVDRVVARASRILARGLNLALQPALSPDELDGLMAV